MNLLNLNPTKICDVYQDVKMEEAEKKNMKSSNQNVNSEVI